MTEERRYTDEEVAEILDRATDTDPVGRSRAGAGAGLTLTELHGIGDEVGIPKDLITRAAASLDRAAPVAPPTRRVLGAPVGVGRTVYLDRPLKDSEWNRLVVDLRETFDARGRVHQEGAFRAWTNGNLQALVEPTESGERVRLKTTKGNGLAQLGLGAVFGGLGVATYTLSLWTGSVFSGSATEALTFAVIGAGLYIGARIRLPGWARTREQQMEGIIERLSASVEAGAPGEDDKA